MDDKKTENELILDAKPYVEPEFMVDAVAAGPAPPSAPTSNEPPIPAGHARFYCNKCHTVSCCIVPIIT
jgi:hypothetical protein